MTVPSPPPSPDSHRLEKYLKIEGFLEKSLKTKPALNSPGESLQGLKFYYFLLDNTVNGDLDQYKIDVLMLHQIKAHRFYTNFLMLNG